MHNKAAFDTDLHRVMAENVKKLREKAKYSQAELAVRAKLSSGYIGMIEQGQRFPSADAIECLAAALNVRPFVLFVDELVDSEALIFNTVHRYSRIFADLVIDDFTKALTNSKTANRKKASDRDKISEREKKIIKLLRELEEEAAEGTGENDLLADSGVLNDADGDS